MQIFISHSGIDKPFVRKLKLGLEKLGLKVWLDEVEIKVGQSISQEVSEALASSEVFCFVISANSNQSSWVNREFNSKLPFIISGQSVLIPCRLDDSPIPAIITDIKYADFRKSFKKGMIDLTNAIRIREKVKHLRLVEETTNKIKDKLKDSDIAFFVYYFSKTDTFYGNDPDFFDWEHSFDSENSLIGTLCHLQLLNYEYEVFDFKTDYDYDEHRYELTQLGKDILEEMISVADATIIAQYEKQYQRRFDAGSISDSNNE